MHLTVGIFGDQELAKKLGKKGTANDIEIYNHASSEGVFIYVCPNSEKVQSLLQVLNMIDIPVLVANNLTKEIGEMIIGIDEMKFGKSFIITSMKYELLKRIKDTSLEKFEFIDEENLRQALLKLKIERQYDYPIMPIDNYFLVKSVGTIVLTIIKSGRIKKYDKLFVEPIGKEVKGGMYVLLSVGLYVATCTIESLGEELSLKSNQTIAYTKNQSCMIASQNDILPRIIGGG